MNFSCPPGLNDQNNPQAASFPSFLGTWTLDRKYHRVTSTCLTELLQRLNMILCTKHCTHCEWSTNISSDYFLHNFISKTHFLQFPLCSSQHSSSCLFVCCTAVVTASSSPSGPLDWRSRAAPGSSLSLRSSTKLSNCRHFFLSLSGFPPASLVIIWEEGEGPGGGRTTGILVIYLP